MSGTPTSKTVRLLGSTSIPSNTSFIWLDTSMDDFEKCKQQFLNETLIPPRDWQFFANRDDCSRFIKQNESKRNIVLVSSGRLLGNDIIKDLHDLPQIHSIYIYCNKKNKYESLKNDYRKVYGVFDDPVQLFVQMCQHLDEDARRSQSISSVTSNTVPIPKPTADNILCLFKHEIISYSKPNIVWCLWQKNSCTEALPKKGKGTIVVWQYESVPFELRISNTQDPNDRDANSYAIVLQVNAREAQLGTINAQHGHELRVRDSTTEFHEVLQLEDGRWHCYWLTFYSEHRVVQYGIGEIRPKFKILEAHFQECDKAYIGGISHVHIKINNSIDINPMEHLKDKLRIFIGEEPVIFDPPLLVISPTDFSPTHPVEHIGVLALFLGSPYRNLYDEVINFTIYDNNFPNFIKTIEHSIKNPDGWCHRKLKEKANQFGKARTESTYLYIMLNELENGAVRHPCAIKIWPPGHHSPEHNHCNAYGIIRVLHGKLLIKFFPALSLSMRQSSSLEQLFVENQVTWMMPELNQTHRMINPDMYGSCCITIECYQYEENDQVHCEHFDFIRNGTNYIDHYSFKPDSNYLDFKKVMKVESMRETAV